MTRAYSSRGDTHEERTGGGATYSWVDLLSSSKEVSAWQVFGTKWVLGGVSGIPMASNPQTRRAQNCKEGDSCWLQDQNFGGTNTLILMDLGFGYGGSEMGFCGPGIYHVTGETMRLMLRPGGGR